jgi:hypothetical protein
MKNLVYIAVTACFFASCNKPRINPDTRLPEGWLPMPQEQIKSYFPVNEGETITYVSENNETATFTCYLKTYDYHPYYTEYKDDGKNGGISKYVPYDDCRASIDFKSEEIPYRLGYYIDVIANRTMLDIGGGFYGYSGSGGRIDLWFENDNSKNRGMGWPKYPNEFMQYLTDEIEFPNRDGNIAAVLKSGKGLIWFLDYAGVKWTLQE